jgi:hypothetical protein
MGHDIVKLDAVSAFTFQSGTTLHVEMGSGKGDRLRVTYCIAGQAVFSDVDGTNGTLIHGGIANNVFGAETDTGFQTMQSIIPGPPGVGF